MGARGGLPMRCTHVVRVVVVVVGGGGGGVIIAVIVGAFRSPHWAIYRREYALIGRNFARRASFSRFASRDQLPEGT